MKILVANLGSTSFKYRLFDMTGGGQLARGGIERIGSPESRCTVEIGGKRQEKTLRVPDHAEAVRQCLEQLTDPQSGCLKEAAEVSAIALKTVHGGRLSGVKRVTADVLAAMEEVRPVAPAHNPPYIAAMRLLQERLPEIPLVAAFETDFHRTIPEANRCYAIPFDWAENWGIRRYGFHGASHRYIARRTAELLGRDDLRIISCHLGGSSSLCAIRDGLSRATSMGYSPQSGLPQNNRVGDFDPFALPVLIRRTGKPLEEVLDQLATQGGLLGLSGLSGDLRDVTAAADGGNARARLALDVFVASIRHYLGAYLVELGGADAVVFTGGIGENNPALRAEVLKNLEELGILLDPAVNASARDEAKLSAPQSRVQVWIIPTNEELIVAQLAAECLKESRPCSSPK
ncbi:MAG: acetate/propionate family kinase [Pirellulales bacterium]|nr:acetate/propionate family kinase [Pirellulales bacterium]